MKTDYLYVAKTLASLATRFYLRRKMLGIRFLPQLFDILTQIANRDRLQVGRLVSFFDRRVVGTRKTHLC